MKKWIALSLAVLVVGVWSPAFTYQLWGYKWASSTVSCQVPPAEPPQGYFLRAPRA